jgi:excisionase family DNA binding protein
MSVAEVARLLSVSTSSVYRWCSNEQLPYFRLGSDHAAIRISGADEHGEDRSVRAGGDGDRRSPVDGDDQGSTSTWPGRHSTTRRRLSNDVWDFLPHFLPT